MNAASSPPPPPPTSEQLHTEMKRLLSSDNSVDIATLAYVWGFPLISNMRTIDETSLRIPDRLIVKTIAPVNNGLNVPFTLPMNSAFVLWRIIVLIPI